MLLSVTWLPKQDIIWGATQDWTYLTLGEDTCLVDEWWTHTVMGLSWHANSVTTRCKRYLEKGHWELLDCLGEVCSHDTAAQAVVPHQPSPAVLTKIEVLCEQTTSSRQRKIIIVIVMPHLLPSVTLHNSKGEGLACRPANALHRKKKKCKTAVMQEEQQELWCWTLAVTMRALRTVYT